MKKICTGCKKLLDLNMFWKKNTSKDGKQSRCIKCKKEQWKEYYNDEEHKEYFRKRQVKYRKNNPIKARAADKRHRDKRQKIINYIKEYYGCAVCGEQEICCLDFHHVDSKNFYISKDGPKVSIKRMFEEMKKCIVVCASCHRKIHASVIEPPSIRIDSSLFDVKSII